MNAFEILGVPEHASAQEIRKAYLRKAREVHPDKCTNCSSSELSEKNEEFKELKQAYEQLSEGKETSTNSPGGAGLAFDGFHLLVGLGLGIVGAATAFCIAKMIKKQREEEKNNRRMN